MTKKCLGVILGAQGQHGLFDRMSLKLGAMDEPLVTGCNVRQIYLRKEPCWLY